MRQSVETSRVLIIEDEPLTGLTLAEMLNEQGHRTIGPIASRKEALAVLEAVVPFGDPSQSFFRSLGFKQVTSGLQSLFSLRLSR